MGSSRSIRHRLKGLPFVIKTVTAKLPRKRKEEAINILTVLYVKFYGFICPRMGRGRGRGGESGEAQAEGALRRPICSQPGRR